MTIVRRQVPVVSGGINEVAADIGGMDPPESLVLKNAFFDTPSTVTVRAGSVDGDLIEDDNGVPAPVTSIPFFDFFPVQGRIFGISHSTNESKHYGFEATTDGLNPIAPATPIPPIIIPVNGGFDYDKAAPVLLGGAGWYNKRCYVHDLAGNIGMIVFEGDLGTISFPNFTLGSGPPAPLRPTWMFNHKNHLILLGYGDENTPKVLDLLRSSVIGDPDQFDAADNFNVGNTQEPLISGISVGDFAVLFKQFQIFRMGGSSALNWSFTEIDPDRGSAAPRALTYFEDFVWFLSNEGFARVGLNGPAELFVDKAKLSFASFDNLENCWVEANVPERMVVFACHENGSLDTFPNLLVMVDTRTGNFVTREYQDPLGPTRFVAMHGARVPQVGGVPVGLGPLGPPTILPATGITSTGWDSNWINGDLTAGTTTRHEFRDVDAAGVFAEDSSTPVPGVTVSVGGGAPPTGVRAGRIFEERVRHERNAIFSIFSPATGGQEVKTLPSTPGIIFTGVTASNVTISIVHGNAAGFWNVELFESLSPPSCPQGAPTYGPTPARTIIGSGGNDTIVLPSHESFSQQYFCRCTRPGFPDSADSVEICTLIP